MAHLADSWGAAIEHATRLQWHSAAAPVLVCDPCLRGVRSLTRPVAVGGPLRRCLLAVPFRLASLRRAVVPATGRLGPGGQRSFAHPRLPIMPALAGGFADRGGRGHNILPALAARWP